MRSAFLVGLYPRAWRDRYGDEMEALLEAASLSRRDRVDLVRGALDAWLHPPTPSRVPAVAALIGGGLWTVAAAAVVFQPAPPDWPGYLLEIVPLALLAAGFLLVATLGCALRVGDRGGRTMAVAVAIALAGYVAWIGALAGTVAGFVDGPSLAAAQAVAMIGTSLVGVVLVRAVAEAIGFLVIATPLAMTFPWTGTWLAYGATWTGIGIAMWLDRAARKGPAQMAG